jgi:hypothetical protein
MLIQGSAGIAIGACAAAGIPLGGGPGRALNAAVLAPTAAIQLRPLVANWSLPPRSFLALSMCAAVLAICTASVSVGLGTAVGVFGGLLCVDSALREQVAGFLPFAAAATPAVKLMWNAIR